MNVKTLGQVFTPPAVVSLMLSLCEQKGRWLEPSCGDGAFASRLRAQRPGLAIELDPLVAPTWATVGDFFDLPLSEQFSSIVGNPPYVRYQDIAETTKQKLTMTRFDTRSNLYLFFIEKCVKHLLPQGELVFIVPRDLMKLSAAAQLNTWLLTRGSFTHVIETGDSPVFDNASPNCLIFRFVKGRESRVLHDGRLQQVVAGQLIFAKSPLPLRLKDFFEVKVGAVSGADALFEHAEGNADFVCSRTHASGATRRMIYNQRHPALAPYRDQLLARKVRQFTPEDWWSWGRDYPARADRRIYVNAKTRSCRPFFLHESNAFDGSVLALFPTARLDQTPLPALAEALNCVDWAELGFVCDGRFLFSQRSLQETALPLIKEFL